MKTSLYLATVLLAQIAQGSAWPLWCPDRSGLCSWTAGQGWTRHWKSKVMWDFETTSNGAVVVLERGHQAPGRTVVLTSERKLGATLDLESQLPFETLWTETRDGDVLLCSGSAASFLCTETVTADGTRRTVQPMFPAGCMLPRFFGEASRACIDAGQLVVSDGETGGFRPVPGLSALQSTRNVVPWRDGLLILHDERIRYWSRGSDRAEPIDTPPVLWLSDSSNIIVATHEETQTPARFAISRLRADRTLRASLEQRLPAAGQGRLHGPHSVHPPGRQRPMHDPRPGRVGGFEGDDRGAVARPAMSTEGLTGETACRR